MLQDVVVRRTTHHTAADLDRIGVSKNWIDRYLNKLIICSVILLLAVPLLTNGLMLYFGNRASVQIIENAAICPRLSMIFPFLPYFRCDADMFRSHGFSVTHHQGTTFRVEGYL